MKKIYLLPVLFFFIGFFVFGAPDEQEELDYLLFLPDNSAEFVNEEQAMIQLDNMAKYLTGRNLVPGQIYVYGYAATSANEELNDIEPGDLSRDRAFHVINELQKRGIQRELFSNPVGYGSVYLWGGNTSEEDRSPNRRVRVLLDGNVLTPAAVKAAEPEIKISSADIDVIVTEQAKPNDKPSSKFPWIILLILILLAILAAIIYLLSKRRKKPAVEAVQETPPPAEPVITSVVVVNLDEEILSRSYELFLERNGQSEDHIVDWYRSVSEISAMYEDKGYQVYSEDGSWWARKSF